MIQESPNAIWTQSPFLIVRYPKAISKRETIVKESKASTELAGLGPESSMHSILINWTEECGWGQRLKGPSTYPEGRPSQPVAKVNMPSTKGRREEHIQDLYSPRWGLGLLPILATWTVKTTETGTLQVRGLPLQGPHSPCQLMS